MVTATDRIKSALQMPDAEVWDVQVAPRGLTVFLKDGRMVPLKMSVDTARVLSHGFHVEIDQN